MRFSKAILILLVSCIVFSETLSAQTMRFTDASVLNTGSWFKFKIQESGVYRFTYEELDNMGITNPSELRIFGYSGRMLPVSNSSYIHDDLVECKIALTPEAVVFYAQSTIKWEYNPYDTIFVQELHHFSDYSYYFMTDDYDSGFDNQVSVRSQSDDEPTGVVDSYVKQLYIEKDSINLLHSGSEWYFDTYDNVTSRTYDFYFRDLIDFSTAKMEIAFLAQSTEISSYTVTCGDLSEEVFIMSIPGGYDSPVAVTKTSNFDIQAGDTDTISIEIEFNKPTDASKAWLDYITINARCSLAYTNEQFHFYDTQSVGEANVSTFVIADASEDLMVWDISDPLNATEMETIFFEGDISFNTPTDTLRHFIAFTEEDCFTPITNGEELGWIENQNLHATGPVEMVIITNNLFKDKAEEIAQIHREHDGFDVGVFVQEEIFNEFSSGVPDVSAIRNFIRMIYERGTETDSLRYVLLFGDGTYDCKGNYHINSPYVLGYQNDNSLNPTATFITDDFFGLLDSNEGAYIGSLDVGIGRFPVQTLHEADLVINKVERYLSTDATGPWRNHVTYIADDGDNHTHLLDAEQLTELVDTTYNKINIDKVYLDAFESEQTTVGKRYPSVNEKINSNIEKGTLIVNYTGHGNERGLSAEYVISLGDIYSWKNHFLPVFVTATCEFSRFDDDRGSAGEAVLLNEGGAIALLSTTRLVYSSPNFVLNRNFFYHAFEHHPNGENYALGDLMRLTKVASGASNNKRNFTLLGDPALQLPHPPNIIKVESFNGNEVLYNENNEIISEADTVNALQTITILGRVGEGGNFNGLLYFTLYDKYITEKTIGNTGDPSVDFQVQNSELFKGNATVTNDIFSFSFTVPLYINFDFGKAKLSFYAVSEDGTMDAAGYFRNFVLGGIDYDSQTDFEGPQIDITKLETIQNENSQDITFRFQFQDESGVNSSGAGIGNDITLILDEENNNPISLNNFYIATNDDQTEGYSDYTFENLPKGIHDLKVKARDVFNNSSEINYTFEVDFDEELVVSHVFNYPNPCVNETAFYVFHNQDDKEIDMDIEIARISGEVVKNISAKVKSENGKTNPVNWNLTDENGNKLQPALYIYRILIRSNSGTTIEKQEKLIINDKEK